MGHLAIDPLINELLRLLHAKSVFMYMCFFMSSKWRMMSSLNWVMESFGWVISPEIGLYINVDTDGNVKSSLSHDVSLLEEKLSVIPPSHQGRSCGNREITNKGACLMSHPFRSNQGRIECRWHVPGWTQPSSFVECKSSCLLCMATLLVEASLEIPSFSSAVVWYVVARKWQVGQLCMRKGIEIWASEQQCSHFELTALFRNLKSCDTSSEGLDSVDNLISDVSTWSVTGRPSIFLHSWIFYTTHTMVG